MAVIDPGLGSEEPGAADLWDARASLWQRLLACELTEVYVASDLGLTVLLPQALGLEPIYAGACYHEVLHGAPIPRERRIRIAQELAAQRFWIVSGSGLNYWDKHFIERAQIVLILLKPPWYRRLARVLSLFWRTVRFHLPSRRGGGDGDALAYEGIAFGVEDDKTQVEFYKRVQAYQPSRYSPQSTMNTTVAGKDLLEHYPEKTVVVSSMRELRQLQALRIRRAWPDAGRLPERADEV